VAERIAALWVTKTVMVWQQIEVNTALRTAIPVEHHREVKQTLRPPATAQVWLARYDGDLLMASEHLQPLTNPVAEGLSLPSTAKGYGGALLIGRLIAQIFAHNLDGFTVKVHQSVAADRFVRIWPPEPSVTWPPILGITDWQFELIDRAFHQPE
jgi:hypothetical protein